jgi:serine/threonine-protein kinase RsbW
MRIASLAAAAISTCSHLHQGLSRAIPKPSRLTHLLLATKLRARLLSRECILPALALILEVESGPVNAPKEGRMSFSLSSTMESVSTVEAAADKLAEEAGLDEDERFHFAMAVREAAVNAVLHGNEYDPAKEIAVSLENTGKSLVIKVADQGKGLDPDTLPDPLAPENLLRGTGRGIFLIRSFMDELHFRQLHPGTELTLVKHLAPAADSTEGSAPRPEPA